jgi:exosortase
VVFETERPSKREPLPPLDTQNDRNGSGNVVSEGTGARLSHNFFLFAIPAAVSILLFLKPLAGILHLSLSQPDASHLLLIPVLAAWVLYLERDSVFRSVSSGWKPGILFYGLGLLFLGLTLVRGHAYGQDWYLSGSASGFVLVLIGSFVFAFGIQAAKAAIFPLLLLFLFVPLPTPILDRLIYLLQWGSTEVTSFLFDLSGIPVMREGFVFHLPRYSIEVAKECSGIRSSMAILILTILVAHFSLRTFGRKVLFVAFGLLVGIVKNGVRIFSLSTLANYVNPAFLFGNLHKQGGVVFFLLGLALLLPVLWLLSLSERRSATLNPAPSKN